MSSYCGKSSGGVNPSQNNIKINAIAKTPVKRDYSESYSSRLRPRPTKQTEHFTSPVILKRQRIVNTFQSKDNCEKIIRNGRLNETAIDKTLSNAITKLKPVKRRHRSLSSKAQTEPSKFKKLASSLPSSDDLSRSESTDTQSTSSASDKRPRSSDSVKPKSIKSKLPHKSKSDTVVNKSPTSLPKKGKVKKWQEKYITGNLRSHQPSSSSKGSTSKTGSCVSSRRGSERAKSSSGGTRSRSSSLRASSVPDEPCSDDSTVTNSLQRATKGNKTSKTSSPQSEHINSSNETASTSRSSSARTNESESSMNNSGAAANVSTANDSGEDPDITRIQALLEARGLPPHFFGSLAPRMQQILHRSMGSGTNSKAQQYLQSIQDNTDESRQLQGAINMCQLLVMGNEDTLIGFPVKNTVPALIALLKKEHNFDLMNHACRALTYMMEALPRSSSVVVDAIPVFLEKLQSIQCMDVAEQSLTALETLSRRHAPSIISAGGFAACLVYIDFFSLPAQRSAINIAANCSLALGSVTNEPDGTNKEFESLVKSSLPILSSRLLQHDKKCVESSALCIVHLIDAYQHENQILASIAETDIMKNLQQLLVLTPPLLSSNTFVNVLRVITVLCSCLRKVSTDLIENNIAETLKYLLCGAIDEENSNSTELVARLPQELYELTSLICELVPKLPTDNELFSINSSLWQTQTGKGWRNFERQAHLDQTIWQWKDENSQWRSYFRHDSRIIEAAFLASEGEVNISIMENSYTIDFDTMHQMNEDSGTTRPVQRVAVNGKGKGKSPKSNALNSAASSKSESSLTDEVTKNNTKALSDFIKTLFTVLYEVYNSSAGSPSVRHKCLQSILPMVYYAEDDLLKDVLQSLTVSSHISSMLCSPDICITVGALQMAEILMNKLPDIFRSFFLREGVVHQVKRIANGELHGLNKPENSASKSQSQKKRTDKSRPSSRPSSASVRSKTTLPATKNKSSGKDTSIKEKFPDSKKSPNSHNTRSSSTSSFLFNFNPSKWGKSLLALNSSSSPDSSSRGSSSMSFHEQNVSARGSKHAKHMLSKQHAANMENMETIKKWVHNQAVKFIREHFNESPRGDNKQTDSDVLGRLLKIAIDLELDTEASINALKELSSIISSMDVSSFELQHSGIVKSLLQYLTHSQKDIFGQLVDSNDNTFTSKIESGENRNLESPSSSKRHTHSESEVAYMSEYKIFSNTHNCEKRVRTFLSVFGGLPDANTVNQILIKNDIFLSSNLEPLQELVKKLNRCVSQLEHLPVKTQDVMSSNAQTLHFFSTRQLKCQLHRHPDCSNVKQWHGGPVRIDPLVQVHAIERYLVARGYGVKSSSANKYKNILTGGDISCDDDDEDNESDESGTNSDLLHVSEFVNAVEDTHSNMGSSATTSSSTSSNWSDTSATHSKFLSNQRLNFYIGNHKLSHDMSVFQAIKQYSATANFSEDESQSTSDLTGNSAIWSKTHVITYELIEADKSTRSKQTSHRGALKKSRHKLSNNKSAKSIDQLWNEGVIPEIKSPIKPYLLNDLPESFLAQDPSKDVLCLLRVLNAITRYWYYLYPRYCTFTDKNLVPRSEFVNTKIDTKCKRQLQDPIMIMTGQLPQWLRDLATICPFLLSFDTRMIYFHVTAFDRDHAMQYLLDSGGRLELSPTMGSSSNSSESSRNGASHHLNPRVEKKKCSVSRGDLLSQAEKIINDYAHSKAVLEIDYKGEVGTGLGPTLEFFTLASREIQRSSLKLWRSDKPTESIKKPLADSIDYEITATENISEDYVIASTGLYPQPCGKNLRGVGLTKKRAKFKFLGKLTAKALADCRMIDITFSPVFYKWLLGMEKSLTDLNMHYIDAEISHTFSKLKEVGSLCAKYEALNDTEKLESVTMDGCPIEDIGLYMVLPGDESFELIKGGKNIPVTSKNLVQYLNLMSHWSIIEGVRKQFESFREGFESVLNPETLSCFSAEELDQVFCGSKYKQWTIQELTEACHPDHGYTQDKPTILTLYRILSSYEAKEQRDFLQFVTGSPHLPVGGLKALNPPLTIVRKTCEGSSNDSNLPSVMTCVNYLKLPEYSSEEIMRRKLRIAAIEGQNSFLLS